MLQPERIREVPKHEVPSGKPKKKIAGTLVAAGATAVISIYSIGYLNTTTPGDSAQAATVVPTTAPAVSSGLRQGAPSASAAPGGAQTQAQAQYQYRDGTYVGSGSSRHGGMQVTVVISGGKITSAAVTSCNTRYPCSDVTPLVNAVVSQQSVPVNHVSGATDSSNAYKQAVSSALAQARSLA